MKHSVFFLLVLWTFTGCIRDSITDGKNSPNPDISDLVMSEDLQKIFSERRNDLMTRIDNGIVVIRSDYGYDGGRHEYRVADNFYYLTGFNQSGSVLVLGRDESYPYSLLLKKRTIREGIYDGETPEFESVMKTYKADTVLVYDELNKIIEVSLRKGTSVYTDFEDSNLRNSITIIFNKLKSPEPLIKDIAPVNS
jgi:hypothetical protein